MYLLHYYYYYYLKDKKEEDLLEVEIEDNISDNEKKIKKQKIERIIKVKNGKNKQINK